jgi:hypothetical protein
MRAILCSLLLLFSCVLNIKAQTPSPSPQATLGNGNEASLQQYREILEHERQLMEQQSEKYYGRIDSLINRTLWVLGTIGGLALALFIWQYGRTKTEMKSLVREQFKEQAVSLIDEEMNTLRKKVETLNGEIKDLQSANEQPITWVFSGTEVTAPQEREALISRGIRNISDFTPPIGQDFNDLANPALVIFSYDRGAEAHDRLRRIVQILRNKNPPVPLIIYTYDPAKPEYRLQEPERRMIGDYLWYLVANYPVTLISQTQTLLRDIRENTRS